MTDEFRPTVVFSASLYGEESSEPLMLSDPTFLSANSVGYIVDLRRFGIDGVVYISISNKGEKNE